MPYRPTERTEARKAETRERIVSAALDQLAEGGYASANVQAIAARAELATGTLYRYFPAKSELFAEATAGERPAAERIAAAVEAFARRALAAPVRAYALIAEPADPRVEAERLVFRRGYRDVLAAVLRDGVESGELAPHDADTVAAALVGAIGEAFVGPLAPGAARAGGREALVAGLVQFCTQAIPKEDSRAGDPAHA